MKILKRFLTVLASLSIVLVLAAPSASAAVSDNVPSQSECDSGSITYPWNTISAARPVIASMSVDGDPIADPTNPADGKIGAAICSNMSDARKIGLTVYRRDGINQHSDLTGATTPSGAPITASSDITITMTNLGDLAEYYTFSLVHGVVSNWQTSNLGAANASLSITFSPARTPLVDYFADPGAEFCTATPPTCNVESSSMDILSASLDMDFDSTPQDGDFSSFRGAYFGLVSSTGGFVTNQGNTLVASLGAPHFLSDGTTPNVGSLQAFLPDAVIQNILQMSPDTIDTASLQVTRTEDGQTSSAPFTVTQVSGGILVELQDITFSSPTYSIQASSQTSSGNGTGNGGTQNNGNNSDDPSLAGTGTRVSSIAIIALSLVSLGALFSILKIKKMTSRA